MDKKDDLATLLEQLFAGKRIALARAISLVENQAEESAGILSAIQSKLGQAMVIGFTGPPGVGKSTLINSFVKALRSRDLNVGIIAVDPSSPISGGAILGDRIRMAEHTFDEAVFTRSLASRGHLGGLSRMTLQIVDLMDASGRDVVLIETVGTGQSEVEVAQVAEIKIVVSAPGLGDDIQAIKSGILEIADIFVVNKSDMPLADSTVRYLQSMLQLRGPNLPEVPIVKTTATDGDGVNALVGEVFKRYQSGARTIARDTQQAIRQSVAEATAHHIKELVQSSDNPIAEDICNQVRQGALSFEAAAKLLVATPEFTQGDSTL